MCPLWRPSIFTGRNEVVAKVIFLHLSVILFTGGPPPPQPGRNPPGTRPPCQGEPPPPPGSRLQHQRAAGTHPTGMHSCMTYFYRVGGRSPLAPPPRSATDFHVNFSTCGTHFVSYYLDILVAMLSKMRMRPVNWPIYVEIWESWVPNPWRSLCVLPFISHRRRLLFSLASTFSVSLKNWCL